MNDLKNLELLSCQNILCFLDLDVSVDTVVARNNFESTAVKLHVISIVLSVTKLIDCE